MKSNLAGKSHQLAFLAHPAFGASTLSAARATAINAFASLIRE
jgi:hypothetical protein